MSKTAERKQTTVSPDVEAFRERLRQRPPSAGNYYLVLLGLKEQEPLDLSQKIQIGFHFRVLERFQRNADLPTGELVDLLQIGLRTLRRRKEEGRLQPDESDRLVRAARIFGRAIELFEGDLSGARSWLEASQPALGGATPFQVARTEVGAREVENLIGRLEHGIPT